MPFAVQLFFDATTDAAIRGIWRALADDDIAPYPHASANHPHLTVALYERLALAESDIELASFAAEAPPFPIDLAYVGLFPPEHEAVIFCAPIVTPHLLGMQAHLHTLLGSLAQGPDVRYVPASWVPHCSLATHCPPERLLDALAVCLRLSLPLHGRIAAIGVTQTSPARPQFVHALRPTTV